MQAFFSITYLPQLLRFFLDAAVLFLRLTGDCVRTAFALASEQSGKFPVMRHQECGCRNQDSLAPAL
jgi:hypothetical protein